MSDLDRIKHLRAELTRHNHLYHTLGTPEITDAQYDTLYQELLRLETAYPAAYDDTSPTQRVGEPVQGFAKIKHGRRLLSLDNAFSAKEVLDRLGEEHVVMEPKVDGLSLKLVYTEGRLVQAVTRGNGIEGDDVTANARTIFTIPLRLTEPVSLEVTGEVYMTYTQFNLLNKELEAAGEELLANPRNAAAGSLKSKEPADVARRGLSFVVHGCFTSLPDIETQVDLLRYLSDLGFQTPGLLPTTKTSSPNVACNMVLGSEEVLANTIRSADERRQLLDLPTDGLVFKLDSLCLQQEMGEGNKSPKWAIAYKFPPERKRTRLVAVTLQVGRTGRITPVAEVEPVLLGGTTVRRASLCNQDEIDRLGINLKDIVYVEKSAEIIPKIVGCASKFVEGSFQIQAACPCCGTKLERPEAQVDLYCPNDDCDDQVYGRLLHALGKQCLDLDGCGRVMVRLLVDNGVRRLSDVFVTEAVAGMKGAALRKFMEGRQRVKDAPLWRKIHALGIENVGTGTSQDIAARFPAFITLFTEDGHESEMAELAKVIGPVAFDSLLRFFGRNADEILRLDGLGFKLREDVQALGPLSTRMLVITGTLISGSRDEVIRKIEAAGGTVKNTVSAKVHFLVEGNDPGQTKVSAARKHGVKVIREEELYALMGLPMTVAVPVSVDDDE